MVSLTRAPALSLLLACVGACSGGGSTTSSPDAGGGSTPEAGHGRDATSDGAHDGPRAMSDAGTQGDAGPHPDADAGAAPDASTDASEAGPDASGADGGDAGAACYLRGPVAYTRTVCPGTPASVPSGLSSAVSAGALGDVVSLGGLDDSSLPCFPVRVCVPASAPTLLFSDDPESPSSDGILYADQLAAGNFRAYVYHTNAGSGLRKFTAVLLNQGTTTVHATILAKGIAGPSQDYVDVGKQALLRWEMSLGANPLPVIDVPAGQRVLLDTDLDAVYASTNDLAHGIIDFSLDGPVKISIVSVLSTEDATVVTSGLSLLPDDGLHERGTFPGANLEIDTIGAVDGAGARHLSFGADVTDEPLQGHDYVDGTDVTLNGNYGVLYTVVFSAGVASGLVLSPQGGDWGGEGSFGSAGTATLLPAAQDSLGTQTDAIVGGVAAAGAKTVFQFWTAGGSNLPVDLVSVPLP